MTITLAILIFVISLLLSAFLIFRDAKKFALEPPTPLVDLDRLYDFVFSQLSESSGSQMTPKELSKILDSFVVLLSTRNLIRDDIAPKADTPLVETLRDDELVEELFAAVSEMNISKEVVADVVKLSFVYLRDINAVT